MHAPAVLPRRANIGVALLWTALECSPLTNGVVTTTKGTARAVSSISPHVSVEGASAERRYGPKGVRLRLMWSEIRGVVAA